jgi:hypothetical protein
MTAFDRFAAVGADAMNPSQTIAYVNGCKNRVVITLGTWAEQFSIQPAAGRNLRTRRNPGYHLELEQTPEGLTF